MIQRSLLGALILSAAALPAARQVDSLEALSIELLLERAADYARRFEQSMATVVLEERYVQIVKGWRQPPREPDLRHLAWSDDLSKINPDVIVLQRRQTKADMLLVQLPDRMWEWYVTPMNDAHGVPL